VTKVGEHLRGVSGLGALGLWLIRYGIAGGLVLAGAVLWIFNVEGVGVDGFSLSAGAGLSLMLFNWLLRMGFKDHEREREERAREYYLRHGRWPDD
jgi:hypothetical protein